MRSAPLRIGNISNRLHAPNGVFGVLVRGGMQLSNLRHVTDLGQKIERQEQVLPLNYPGLIVYLTLRRIRLAA